MVAGLVDGGAPGNVGVRIWGTKVADSKVVAHIADLLGAPAPAQTSSVRVRGYRVQLGLPVDEYAQLRSYYPGGIRAASAYPRPPQHPRPASL